jgi:hypothetical protein
MTQDSRPPDGRSDAFAAAAGELVEEVQSTIRHDEPDSPEQRGPSAARPIALGIVFAGVLAWNVVLLRASAEPLSPVETRRSEGVLVFVATQAVEGYRAEHGRFPSSLSEAGIDTPGLVYSVRPDGFSIASAAEGSPVRFEKGQQVDGFLIDLGIAPPEALIVEPGG